jgi:hypothetical protein
VSGREASGRGEIVRSGGEGLSPRGAAAHVLKVMTQSWAPVVALPDPFPAMINEAEEFLQEWLDANVQLRAREDDEDDETEVAHPGVWTPLARHTELANERAELLTAIEDMRAGKTYPSASEFRDAVEAHLRKAGGA